MSTTRFLWRLILYRRWWYIGNVIAWTLHYLGPILPGLVLASFFDRLENGTATGNSVLLLVAYVIAIGVGRLMVAYVAIYGDTVWRFDISGLLRRNLFEHMQKLPGAGPLPEPASEMISRFRDDALFAEQCLDWTLDVLGSLVFTIVALLIMAQIDARMTFVVFLPLLSVLVLARLVSSYVERYREASRDATEQVTGAIGEAFGAVQSVQLSRAEGHVVDHLRRLNAGRLRVMVLDRLFTQVLSSIYQNNAALATGLVLLLASRGLRSGDLSVGELALFVYYMAFATDFVRQFGRFITVAQQTGVSARRMAASMVGEAPEALVRFAPLFPPSPPGQTSFLEEPQRLPLTTLEVRGLTYVHESGRGVIDAGFTLERGTITVVTGRIGSGKTTLLRAMLGLLPAAAGEMRWNETVVEEPAVFFTPANTAYVPQVPQLFSNTMRENIVLGQPVTDEVLQSAVATAVLEHDVAQFPAGLDTVVGPKGVRLSGGQVQRVAAARAVIREPELLVLDDLSSALDVETEERVWERVFAGHVGACLAVSHRRRVLERADNIIVLKDGHVEAQGRLVDLLETCEEMRLLWRLDVIEEGAEQLP